jgi:hypothetical protein
VGGVRTYHVHRVVVFFLFCFVLESRRQVHTNPRRRSKCLKQSGGLLTNMPIFPPMAGPKLEIPRYSYHLRYLPPARKNINLIQEVRTQTRDQDNIMLTDAAQCSTTQIQIHTLGIDRYITRWYPLFFYLTSKRQLCNINFHNLPSIPPSPLLRFR